MVNLPIENSAKPVTLFGEMSLFKRFIDKIGVDDFLDEFPLPQHRSNRGYAPSDIVKSFWLGIWTGASRYIHCDQIWYDNVLQEIFGFKQMPSQSTYNRFLGKFSDKSNTTLFPQMQSWIGKDRYRQYHN